MLEAIWLSYKDIQNIEILYFYKNYDYKKNQLLKCPKDPFVRSALKYISRLQAAIIS